MLFKINHYTMNSNLLNKHLLRQLSTKHCARLIAEYLKMNENPYPKRFYKPVCKTDLHISRVWASQQVQ